MALSVSSIFNFPRNSPPTLPSSWPLNGPKFGRKHGVRLTLMVYHGTCRGPMPCLSFLVPVRKEVKEGIDAPLAKIANNNTAESGVDFPRHGCMTLIFKELLVNAGDI